jgi:hypothetical protein
VGRRAGVDTRGKRGRRKKKKKLDLAGIEQRFLGHPCRNMVTVLQFLHWF